MTLALAFAAPAAADDDQARAVTASLEARASAGGEQAGRAVAAAQLGAFAVRAGAESSTGAHAPLRHAAIAGAGFAAEEWEAEGEVRVAPPQEGAEGFSAELTARRALEPASIAATLGAHRSAWASCGTCAAQVLSGTGGIAEIEIELSSAFRAGLRATAWQLQLREPLARSSRAPTVWHQGPWDRFGASTLDWPSRWEAAALAQGHLGHFTAALSGGLGAPPSPGVLATRATLRLECAVDQVTGAVTATGAHLAPTGQVLAELALSLGVRFGGVP